MNVDWDAIGKVCGALLALAGVLAVVAKGLGLMWQWRFGAQLTAALARIEGRQRRQARSTEAQFRQLQAQLDAHVARGHDDPGWPAAPRPIRPEPNGTGQRTRR